MTDRGAGALSAKARLWTIPRIEVADRTPIPRHFPRRPVVDRGFPVSIAFS